MVNGKNKLMKHRAQAALGLSLVLGWLLLSGCMVALPQPSATPVATGATQGSQNRTGDIADTPVYPVTLTDALGREITLTTQPQAIIPISPSITEILFAIGAGPQVIARTQHDAYPAEVAQLPSVGGITARSLSLEVLVDLEPDLVIAGSRGQAELVEQIAQFEIPVFVLAPTSLQEIKSGILSLGILTGNQDRAQAVVQKMQDEIDAVTTKIAAIPAEQRMRVYYEVWNNPLTTTTRATFIGELIELAGGINLFADLEGAYPNISDEQVIALDPQLIVSPDSNGEAITAADFAARPAWQSLTAVQNEAIYVIDGDMISRPGPRVTTALQILAAYFYPEHFAE